MLLGKAYEDVARLDTHRKLLARVVAILVEKQEVGGAELRQLLASEGTATSG